MKLTFELKSAILMKHPWGWQDPQDSKASLSWQDIFDDRSGLLGANLPPAYAPAAGALHPSIAWSILVSQIQVDDFVKAIYAVCPGLALSIKQIVEEMFSTKQSFQARLPGVRYRHVTVPKGSPPV